EPQETYETEAKVVYHGTIQGGFQQFDPEKVNKDSLYGPGFYFTEDKGIAEEYAQSGKAAFTIAHYPTKERAEEAVKLRLEEWARQYSGGHPEGLEFFVLHDPQSPEKFQWSVRGRTKLSEVKACYLNIRKPYNMDTSMSEQDAQTLWGALPGQRFE